MRRTRSSKLTGGDRLVLVLKRGKGKGFSGLENPLFLKPVTGMLYGGAKTSLTNLAQAVQKV